MNWSEVLKQRIAIELNGYDVYFTSCDVPLEVKYPKQWLGFGFFDEEKNISLLSGPIFLKNYHG